MNHRFTYNEGERTDSLPIYTQYIMWDGSSLGEISPEQIIEKHSIDISASSSEESSPKTRFRDIGKKKHKRSQEYWYTTIKNVGQWVAVKPLKNMLPIIIDELKPLFGLTKIGTHIATVSGHNYIIFRQNEQYQKDVRPFRDLRLSEAPRDMTNNGLFRQLVQYTYCFRMIIGVTCCFDRNIVIRKQNNWDMPISTGENNVNFQKHRISKTTLNKWYGEVRPDFVLQTMLNLDESSPEEVSATLSKLRSKIEATIMRVDKNEIWMSAYVMERVQKASEARVWERKDTASALRGPDVNTGFTNSIVERAIAQVQVKEAQQPLRRSTRKK